MPSPIQRATRLAKVAVMGYRTRCRELPENGGIRRKGAFPDPHGLAGETASKQAVSEKRININQILPRARCILLDCEPRVGQLQPSRHEPGVQGSRLRSNVITKLESCQFI